ncbi:segregation and condensation protein A [Abyssisolibacter fermentans]|uniref:segregation and condensation protein A n=1 Tax=Abyssisolibacter fermentans TaxID=1766203 RepID=UPI00082C9E53|nr:segregation/condensation protein A [Abyssisolibacter fermentans]
MEYKVILDSFEGPLDLLLHLIDKAEVDIYDISITQITDQYLSYLEKMEELDLEITSEFLVMAATLLVIKSKMLLPKEKKDKLFDNEEMDPRDELIQKLIEYKKFKAAALDLKDKEIIQSMIYAKPQEDMDYYQEESIQLTFDGIKLNNLVNALYKVLRKNKYKTNENTFDNIHRDSITIEESMEYILYSLSKLNVINFEEIFANNVSKFEVVVTFLALLELIKLNKVTVYQKDNFEQIEIKLI